MPNVLNCPVRHFRFRINVARSTSPILCAVLAEDRPIAKVLYETTKEKMVIQAIPGCNMMGWGSCCGTWYIRRQIAAMETGDIHDRSPTLEYGRGCFYGKKRFGVTN